MNSEFRDEARRIFMEAFDRPSEERPAFLDQACGGNAELRAEVEALLEARQQAGSFLAEPTVAASDETVASTSGGVLREGPGTQIGPYRLIRKIGEGGFGVVFEAQQETPARRVALKIIKLGMDTQKVVARFEQERQALALMEHPNIARVFGGGATDTGRPYFVMELVSGRPITDYCDLKNLSVRERLQLFEQVCMAVQHAHTKGVMHRDIKPSNVLVSVRDDKPEVKIIDFGIARATDAAEAERHAFTEEGQWIGTPAYMSPEQAAGSKDIDTRTDIYSLGVLLYELLTGTTPFDSKQLRSMGLDKVMQMIRDEPPPKPSTRLRQTSDTVASVAARRSTEPKRLGTLVRGELDWIVMKALEKERHRRYDSASGFAEDIRRYLDGKPVEAAPPSKAYRLRKFVARNKGLVSTISFIVSVVIAASSITTVFYRQRANETRLRLQEERHATALKKFTQTALEIPDQFRAGVQESRTPEATIKNTERLLSDDLNLDPSIRATLLDSVAGVLFRNGDVDKALAPATEALAIRKQLYKTDHPELARAYYLLGSVQHSLGNPKEAESLFTVARDMARRLFVGDHEDIAEYESDLALAIQAQGRNAEAEPMLASALAMYRRLHTADDMDLAAAIKNLGRIKLEEGRATEAESLYEEAAAMRRRLYPGDHPFAAISLLDLGEVQYSLGKNKDAEKNVRTAYEMCQRHAEWRADVRNWAEDLYKRILVRAGDIDSLVSIAIQKLQAGRKALSVSNQEFATDLSRNSHQLLSYANIKASQTALPLLRECLAIRERVFPDGTKMSWLRYYTSSLLGDALLGSVGIFSIDETTTPTSSPTSQPDPDAIKAALTEAEPHLLRALENLNKDPNTPAPETYNFDYRKSALERVARLYDAWSKIDPTEARVALAAEWRKKLADYSTPQASK